MLVLVRANKSVLGYCRSSVTSAQVILMNVVFYRAIYMTGRAEQTSGGLAGSAVPSVGNDVTLDKPDVINPGHPRFHREDYKTAGEVQRADFA